MVTPWFELLGTQYDYFIAVGITYANQYEFPFKKFFWALSKDFEFKEMPDLNDQHKAAVNAMDALFEGNPMKKLVSVKKEGEGNLSRSKKNLIEDEEAAQQEAPGEMGEEEEGANKVNLSDMTEEEEIKIPSKDLTGKVPCLILFHDRA